MEQGTSNNKLKEDLLQKIISFLSMTSSVRQVLPRSWDTLFNFVDAVKERDLSDFLNLQSSSKETYVKMSSLLK